MKTQHSPRVTLTPLAQKIDVMDDECLVNIMTLARPPVPRPPSGGVQGTIQRRSAPSGIKGRDYLLQVQKVNTKYNCYVQKRSYRDKRLIHNMQLPFSVPGDFHNVKSDIPHIIAQPKAMNYIYENADNLQEKSHPQSSKIFDDSSMNVVSTNEQTPDNQPKEHKEIITMTTQLLPGDPVLYYNKQTQQLVSGIYSTVFTQKFGPPIYRDSLLQNNFRCCSLNPIIYNYTTKNYFVNVALKFTQVSNYIKINNNTDVDLLILTNEIIGDWRTHITEEQQIKLQNTILISLMALKQ